MPFDPVFDGGPGRGLSAPGLEYHERRADWQAYIDRSIYHQD